tara:strand:- start:39 stop:143 length:105 start_codon:yes stop_codon:yes gene_type:complete
MMMMWYSIECAGGGRGGGNITNKQVFILLINQMK